MYTDPDLFVKDWIAALRGGDYPQTEGKLQTDIGFCCLGVACDLYARDSNEEYWIPCANYYMFKDPNTDQKDENSLPGTLVQFLELTHDDDGENPQELPIPIHIARHHAPGYMNEGTKVNAGTLYITTLNDNGCPFPIIADIIEQWWKEKKETA